MSIIYLISPLDLYVKLYVVNVATQKRIIKKKTRVCRHDREPSFNETFRFPLNPTGHSIQVPPTFELTHKTFCSHTTVLKFYSIKYNSAYLTELIIIKRNIYALH